MENGQKVKHLSGWKAVVTDGRGEVITVKAEDDRYSGTYHESAFEKESDEGSTV